MSLLSANQSDFLVIYDAKHCNPNGDPNTPNNQPRYDNYTQRLQVSSYAAKRYPREYAKSQGQSIMYQKYDNKTLDLENAVKTLKISSTEQALEKLYDVRVFGAPFAMKNAEKKFYKVKGAIQIAEGESLNRAELVTSALTSHFSSKAGNEAGTIGSYSFVKYALVALAGNINKNQAEQNGVSSDDVSLFDKGMTSGINQFKSQGKRNQNARMYIRFEYHDDRTTCLGDLRDYITLTQDENLHGIQDVELDITQLVQLVKQHQEKIKEIHVFQHEHLRVISEGQSFQVSQLNEIVPVYTFELS